MVIDNIKQKARLIIKETLREVGIIPTIDNMVEISAVATVMVGPRVEYLLPEAEEELVAIITIVKEEATIITIITIINIIIIGTVTIIIIIIIISIVMAGMEAIRARIMVVAIREVAEAEARVATRAAEIIDQTMLSTAIHRL